MSINVTKHILIDLLHPPHFSTNRIQVQTPNAFEVEVHEFMDFNSSEAT